MMRICFLIAFSVIFNCIFVFAQDEKITIKGKVVDKYNPDGILNLMIVNQNTQQGIFGNAYGQFDFKAKKSDTLLIACTGYSTKKICFRDSSYKDIYDVIIEMDKLRIMLKEVQVFPERDLSEIHKEFEKLGYTRKDYVLSGVDAFSSPITFLYQSYSRRERSKRLVAQLENEDRKRELLKELLRKYVNGDIIKLSPDKFDEFIDYCNVPD